MPPSSSMYGSRSMTSIASARSRATVTHSLPGSRKVQQHWWQKRPILNTAFLTDLQKGSYYAAIFTLVESCLQIILATFDAYCLIEARPGSKHFRSFGISFLFVYAGNEHIRRTLIASSIILLLSAFYLLSASVILMAALRKEHEVKFKHWLRAMGTFIVARTVTLIFQSIVNDLYFGYHQAMLVIWFLLTAVNVFAFLVVASNFQELSNITRLEDMAKLKMSTLSSLNASRSLSRNSLDSYKTFQGPPGHQPSLNVSMHGIPGHNSRGGSTTGSIASFNMNYPQPSPRVGHNSPSAASIPLSAFGLNFNPNGVFTTQQLTGTSPHVGSTSLGRGSTPSTGPI